MSKSRKEPKEPNKTPNIVSPFPNFTPIDTNELLTN